MQVSAVQNREASILRHKSFREQSAFRTKWTECISLETFVEVRLHVGSSVFTSVCHCFYVSVAMFVATAAVGNTFCSRHNIRQIINVRVLCKLLYRNRTHLQSNQRNVTSFKVAIRTQNFIPVNSPYISSIWAFLLLI